jgi:hypothetical protein
MKKSTIATCLLLMIVALAEWPPIARAQGSFELVTGKAFDAAMPNDFYLEGNRIPTEKRNAAMVKTPAGARALFALLDTTGYSSQIKQKYIGMLINETLLSVCGTKVYVGSYGFGLDRPAANSKDNAKFHLYNQAGAEVASCAAPLDSTIKVATPLKFSVSKAGPAALVLGRYRVDVDYIVIKGLVP